MASDKEKKNRIRDNIRIISGWLFLALGAFLLVAFVSYLFNWTVDQSLLSGDSLFMPEDSAANSGGFIGNRWADLFIGKLFGLSAFILPFFLPGCFCISAQNSQCPHYSIILCNSFPVHNPVNCIGIHL